MCFPKQKNMQLMYPTAAETQLLLNSLPHGHFCTLLEPKFKEDDRIAHEGRD